MSRALAIIGTVDGNKKIDSSLDCFLQASAWSAVSSANCSFLDGRDSEKAIQDSLRR
jgi:hypothetical protein